jgi:hypothetical protein
MRRKWKDVPCMQCFLGRNLGSRKTKLVPLVTGRISKDVNKISKNGIYLKKGGDAGSQDDRARTPGTIPVLSCPFWE